MPKSPAPAPASVVQGANGRSAPPRTATILGLGHALPAQVIPNGPIAARMGVDDAWIVRRTGVHERRHLRADERVSDLATEAGRAALADAGVDGGELDLVLVATMSPDEVTPNTAPLVAHGLGAARAGALDVGAACTGWVAGLELAAAVVEAGRAQKVLLVGAEALSRLTDFDDVKTAALFGDGAGAVLVGAEGEGSLGPILLRQDGSIAALITAERDGGKLRMEGHETFVAAVARLAEITQEACATAGLTFADVDLFVYHQANARILRALGERLGLPAAKVVDYVGQTANTSAASIPLALSLARADGRLRAGQRVLVAGIGAGFTWGAGILEWGLA